MSTEDHDNELAELLEEVRLIEAQARRLVTDVMAGGYHSVFRGSGIEFDEVREYADGDDVSSIDWNVTARMGRPYVKKYVDERELTVLFLLDLSPSMSQGFSSWTARQMAARICGCLALTAVQNNDKVGLIACGEDVEAFVPPETGRGHVLRVVRDCLALPASGTTTDLLPALQMAGSLVKRHAILFVVSDFLVGGWEDALHRCSRRHDVIAVRIGVPELTPPRSGLMRIRDPETGVESVVDWSSPAVREAYEARVTAWREATDRSFRRSKVDVIDVPVPLERDRDAIAKPILDFFRMRGRRGSRS